MTPIFRPLSLLLALGLVPAFGCNLGPGGNGDDDDATGDDDDATGGDATVVTIQQIHDGDVPEDTFIRIEGVVVTTPMLSDEDDNEGAFWIAHPDGGPASGLYVYTFYDVIESLEDADAAEPGDVVNITGTFKLAFTEELPELQLTNAANVEVVGSTSLPAPYVVDAADIAGGFADRELWGAIVAVENVTADTTPTFDTFLEWEADGVIVVDDFWYADVESGYTIDRLVGVLHMNYGDASLFPRWAEDARYSHPGCDAAWDETTIQGLRCRVVDEETEVTVTGVVTSPEPFFGDAFYIQDIDAAGGFTAIQVFAIFDDLVIPAIGTEVTVTGEAEEYRGASELVIFSGSDVVSGANRSAELVPLDIADPCTINESHEGMLVRIPSATVDALDFNSYPFDGCSQISVGSMFWSDLATFEADAGGAGEITNLVGIVSERFDEMRVNPRDDLDWDSWDSARCAAN